AGVAQRAKRTATRSTGGLLQPATLLALFIALAFVLVLFQSLQTAHPERVAADRRRRRELANPASSWGGGWGGTAGRWSGGDPGGGGFSGGGGDFGGGGSSGSW